MSVVHLHIVLCSDGNRAHLGDKQAEWAEAEGLIRLAEVQSTGENTGIRSYGCTLGAWELHGKIAANPDMRECDICGKKGPWEYPCRVFEPSIPSLKGAVIGGPERPLYVCFMCGTWITGRRRRELVQAMMTRAARAVAASEGIDPDRVVGLSVEAVAAIKPMLQEFVGQVLEHTHGRPKRRR